MNAKIITIFALAMVTSLPALADNDAPAGTTAAPPQPAPTEIPQMPATPPAPPSTSDTANQPPVQTAPPTAAAPQAPQPPPAQGQWVYTSQYGWVYMPYARNYTYVDAAGELAFAYAYYPAYGWRWLAAPWVLGWGPTPYWGTWGCGYFSWYARPWFHVGVYRPAVWGRWGGPYGGWHGGYAPAYHGGGFARPAFGGYRGGWGGGFHGGGGFHHR